MKRRYYSLLHFIFMVLVVSACASTVGAPAGDGGEKKKTAGSGEQPKTEDLSKYRPKFTLPDPATRTGTAVVASPGMVPVNHVNERVAALMDTVASLNKQIRVFPGYRILAYSGTERKAWMDIRKAIVGRVPEERDYPVYVQPNYRLKIGDFFTRVEAQQVLSRIKDIIPNAMIIADQVNVR